MKCSTFTFAIATFAIAVNLAMQPASANQTNSLEEKEASRYHQSSTLRTEPATINSRWGYDSEQTNNLNDSVNSISINNEDECRKIDPNEILKNPGSFFRQCPLVEKNQTPELGEKIQYFQVPKLDSGIKLNLTQF
jgi:hypothetical protein